MKMRKSFVSVLCLSLLPALMLGGCGKQAGGGLLNEEPVDLSSAAEITIDQDAAETDGLFQEAASIDEDAIAIDPGEGKHANVDFGAANEDASFYLASYSEDMAQYSYFNQIYRHDLGTGEDSLFYETDDAIWVNELAATKDALFWVEYLPEGDKISYHVMRLALDGDAAECIATLSDDKGEPCLEASDRYVTWYDYKNDGSDAKISIYDDEKQEFLSMEDDMMLAAPYGRLEIVDNGITYFSEDEEGNLYVNRYDIGTKGKDVLLLGSMDDYDKLAECFSDSEYLGWYEEYSWGPYYLYHMDDGKLYKFDPPEGMEVFAANVSSGIFYVNDTSHGVVYAYDLASGETKRESISPGADVVALSD